MIQYRLRENQRKLPYIPYYDPAINQETVFWILQVVDVVTTAEGVKYSCITEANPLLPKKPDYEDLIVHKLKWVSWIPLLVQNSNLSNEEKNESYIPGNWLMLGVAFNNLHHWRNAINSADCPRIK